MQQQQQQHTRRCRKAHARSCARLQVSDLDGTMVGTGPEPDAATAAFTQYWENTAALAGGVLVYNTGRSLGQFQELLQSKAGVLAVPNALITAVGTKVCEHFQDIC